MEEFTCTCGGTIPVPSQPTERQIRIDAMCSNACGRLWVFLFSPGGQFLGQPPTLDEG